MKKAWIIFGLAFVITAPALAQEAVESTAAPAEAEAPADGEQPEEEEKKSLYEKKVGGIFFFEGQFGPGRIDLTGARGFLDEDLTGPIAPAVRHGASLGFTTGVRLGATMIGFRFEGLKSNPTIRSFGLNLDFLIRAVPYVHPYFRLAFMYSKLTEKRTGVPEIDNIMTVTSSKGGTVLAGLGVRIPIIKYLSFAVGLDAGVTGIAVEGNVIGAPPDAMGNPVTATNGVGGLRFSGTFGLAFHI